MKRLMFVALVGILFVSLHAQNRQAQPDLRSPEPRSEPSSTHVLDGPKVSIAGSSKALAPITFTTSDGKKGWKVTIPGGRPLATPAVADGRIFVGGGFGSHEFYAFDAATGTTLWQYRTKDDGPTSAVVQDGFVAFNTESCEIEILTMDGKPVWKKWLGDPLMSMPAVANGKVYIAYPDSRGDRKHYLASFDLKTGAEFWKRPIAGEVITAPVVDLDHVYLATLEGTLYNFDAVNGQLTWSERKNATSSPMVWNGQCYFSRREEITLAQAGKQQTEQLARRAVVPVAASISDIKNTLVVRADYLDSAKKMSSRSEQMKEAADAGVGFAAQISSIPTGQTALAMTTGKGDSKLHQAYVNLGEKTVSGVWSYQGSKPFVYRGSLYSAMGNTLKCVNPTTEKLLWQTTFVTKDKTELADRMLTPPALVNGKIFLCTVFGHVLCLSAQSGSMLWTVNVGEPIVFQAAVVKGRVYFSTQGGLYSIETGDPRDDGWMMWGGRPSHNGLPN